MRALEDLVNVETIGTIGTIGLIDKAFALGAVQMREEISALVELLRTVPLRNVMEIGAESGGTFYLWCQLAVLGGIKISLDLPDGASGSGRYSDPRALAERTIEFQSWSPRVRVITGDSHAPLVKARVLRALNGEKLDFLFIDGDHSYKGVKADWEDYRGLVRTGGLIAFHDIKDTEFHRKRGCFVAHFWAELKALNRWMEFSADQDYGGIGVVVTA
jgi:cephalosporin hydroxylase